MENKWRKIEEELNFLKDHNLYRTLKPIEPVCGAHVKFHGRDMITLSSNNYLNLSNHDAVKEFAKKSLNMYGVGSGGSRLTTGNTEMHEMLEKRLASFKHTEAALVFNTGYVANLATISALCEKNNVIFSDEWNHASIIDGCRMSKADVVIYKHNNMVDLEKKVQHYPGKRGLLVSDAVFSMDGDIVNLPELMRIADTYGFLSMIDEAHATGVIGKTGRGTAEYYGLKKPPDIFMGTLSKAIGSEGGFVCGNTELIEYLKNKARGFIFSTSLSPVVIAASCMAIEVIETNPEIVKQLQENVKWFCQCLQGNGIKTCSQTAIVPMIIGDERKALAISRELFEKGFDIPAIRYPTVPKGSARLRVTLMSAHTKKELHDAAEAIGRLVHSACPSAS